MTVEDLKTSGMAMKVKDVVDEIEGVIMVNVDPPKGMITVDYDDTGTNSSEIANTVMDMGFSVQQIKTN